MDVKKKKFNTMDSIKLNNTSKLNFRNELISAKESNKLMSNTDTHSIDDGISSVSHSNSNPNELNKISAVSSGNLAAILNLANQNLTPSDAYSTAQQIKVNNLRKGNIFLCHQGF